MSYVEEFDFKSAISRELNFKKWQVSNLLELVAQDNSVHFIARYRKEKTGNLDENQIRGIIEKYNTFRSLNELKDKVIKNIDEQGN